jgi:hypothetical protein
MQVILHGIFECLSGLFLPFSLMLGAFGLLLRLLLGQGIAPMGNLFLCPCRFLAGLGETDAGFRAKAHLAGLSSDHVAQNPTTVFRRADLQDQPTAIVIPAGFGKRLNLHRVKPADLGHGDPATITIEIQYLIGSEPTNQPQNKLKS